MRTLTNTELNQLAGGLKKAEENDTVKTIATGLGLGLFIGFYFQGEGLARSSIAAVIPMGCYYLANKIMVYCATFLTSSET